MRSPATRNGLPFRPEGLLAALLLLLPAVHAEEPAVDAPALRALILRHAGAAAGVTATMSPFGQPVPVKILKAEEKGLTVQGPGFVSPVTWESLKPEALAEIASGVSTGGADHLAIARFLSARGLAARARAECEEALKDPASVAAARELLAAIQSDEEKKGAAAAEAARTRQEADQAARLEREREARKKLNHEGRRLPPLPKITAVVLCNTPEADAILSALQVFPKDSHWNADVSKLPVLKNSAALGNNLARGATGRAATEFTFAIVPPTQPRVKVTFDPYPESCDREPYPIPDNLPVENWADQAKGEGDRHTAVLDPVNMRLYELYQAYKVSDGWKGFGCIFNLASNKSRPKGWTSSDAAGLPIFPALVRYDECERGMVEHAMRVCVPKTRNEAIYPAVHATATGTDPDLPAMGQRFRLKADVDISKFSKHARAMALGLKKYGMFVTDNGDEMAICAVSDTRLQLRDIRSLKKTDFEAVDTSGLPIPRD